MVVVGWGDLTVEFPARVIKDILGKNKIHLLIS